MRLTNEPVGSPYQSMLIQATDTGKFSNVPDTVFFELLTTPSPPDGACPTPFMFTGFTVVKGDVVIDNTLP